MNDTLQELILTVETRLGTVEDTFAGRGNDYLVWQERHRAYRGILNDLVSQEKAKYRIHNGIYELSLSGIRSSCTAGEHGLLTVWLRKAKVAQEARRVG